MKRIKDLCTRQRTNTSFWWQQLHPFRNISKDTFYNHIWQSNHSVNGNNIIPFLQNLNILGDAFIEDVSKSIQINTMSIRVTPYILSLIDWENPYMDPLRKQFIPTYSTILPDHPKMRLDSLNETDDSPVNGIVHRYPNKTLFLALSVCPVYCRYCTRSYSVGSATQQINSKICYKPSMKRINDCIRYISDTKSIQDVLISGGDTYLLAPNLLEYIAFKLLDIDHIKRIRIATRGLSVMPSKLLTDEQWFNAVLNINRKAYGEYGKHFAIHTHFNHSNEITDITKEAMEKLMKHQITVRNQTVCMKNINDSFDEMHKLIINLSDIGIVPYYVFAPDMIPGTEEFRVSLKNMIDIEKQIIGFNSGYLIPKFAVDLPNGGGKRNITSYESYNNGIAHYKSYIRSDREIDFYYYDPLWM